jgi:hypothetical protein
MARIRAFNVYGHEISLILTVPFVTPPARGG